MAADARDLYGRPTAEELLEALREFLADEVMPATEGAVQFHARVALRVVDTVTRQLQMAERHLAEHGQRMRDLGHDDARGLVEAIRAGAYDHRLEELAAILEPEVQAKVEVSDPRYLASSASSRSSSLKSNS